MKERRKFTRFKSLFCVQYESEEIKEGSRGVIRDISYGGAKILLDNPNQINLNSLASISIFFPDQSLKTTAKVMWAKDLEQKKEVGFYFVKLRDAYKQTIYNQIFKYFKDEITKKWWE